jgi:hypothetical protein
MWKPRRLTTLRASTASYGFSFTFLLLPLRMMYSHLMDLEPGVVGQHTGLVTVIFWRRTVLYVGGRMFVVYALETLELLIWPCLQNCENYLEHVRNSVVNLRVWYLG